MYQPSNAKLYEVLLAYPNTEAIPYDALAKQFKVKRMKLVGLGSALVRGDPKALLELKEIGYGIEELPSWVGSKPRKSREEKLEEQPQAGGEKLPQPTKTAEEEAKELAAKLQAKKEAEKKAPLNALGNRDSGDAALSSSPSYDSSYGSSYPPATGEAMGDALQLMNQKEEGSIVEFEGRKYRVSNVNGELKLTPVSQLEVRADPALAAAMSKAIMESMEVNMLAVAKKVALSPVVVIGHGMVTSMRDPDSGKPLFVGDLGDFINWACSFALLHAFGIKIGVITGAPSLMSLMKAQDKGPAFGNST